MKWKWKIKNRSVNMSNIAKVFEQYFNTLPNHLQNSIIVTDGRRFGGGASRHNHGYALDLSVSDKGWDIMRYMMTDPNLEKHKLRVMQPYHGKGGVINLSNPHIHIEYRGGSTEMVSYSNSGRGWDADENRYDTKWNAKSIPYDEFSKTWYGYEGKSDPLPQKQKGEQKPLGDIVGNPNFNLPNLGIHIPLSSGTVIGSIWNNTYKGSSDGKKQLISFLDKDGSVSLPPKIFMEEKTKIVLDSMSVAPFSSSTAKLKNE